jgi:hypothetical protein
MMNRRQVFLKLFGLGAGATIADKSVPTQNMAYQNTSVICGTCGYIMFSEPKGWGTKHFDYFVKCTNNQCSQKDIEYQVAPTVPLKRVE